MEVITGLPVTENTVSPALAWRRIAIAILGCTLGVINPMRSQLKAFGLALLGVLYLGLKSQRTLVKLDY